MLIFIVLLAGFIFRGRVVFQNKFRPVLILIFLTGVVSIANSAISDNKKAPSNDFVFYDADVYNSSYSKNIVLEDNMAMAIAMNVQFSKGKQTPQRANSVVHGFVSGFVWEAKSIYFDDTNNYTALGMLKWELLGINIYSQPKLFKGKL